MSNVIFITYETRHPMMASFGMSIKTIDKKQNFESYIKSLEERHVEIAYVSYEVYRKHSDYLDTYSGNIAFILFDGKESTNNTAKKRMKDLLASSIGIQSR